ncbi:transposase InsO family protein [Streptomyces echinatus]|uniref:Transposase InsO family protein n=1 Tax=Streptomyces echinatus TaxID=67293 RepID=A0A7W9Q3A7_9ACTN|nr:transposase InsO family protein [Streptomyces echinatus]
MAAEAGISRRCLAKWYARWRAQGENGLLDHSSRPATSPARTPEDTADLVEALRRQTKHGPAPLASDLQRLHGVTLAPATVHRITKHKRTRPYAPRTNGKVKRYSGTLSREWAYVRDYTTERERRVALMEFANYYNHERPHAALGGRPSIGRTAGSDYRIVFDQPPEPLADIPQQLTFEDFA